MVTQADPEAPLTAEGSQFDHKAHVCKQVMVLRAAARAQPAPITLGSAAEPQAQRLDRPRQWLKAEFLQLDDPGSETSASHSCGNHVSPLVSSFSSTKSQ